MLTEYGSLLSHFLQLRIVCRLAHTDILKLRCIGPCVELIRPHKCILQKIYFCQSHLGEIYYFVRLIAQKTRLLSIVM